MTVSVSKVIKLKEKYEKYVFFGDFGHPAHG
jgi:hypothetical protein